jgi:ribosomal protein S9
MTTTITIEGKVLGRRKAALADWTLALPPEWEADTRSVRLRDLITRVVLDEVEAFHERQARRQLLEILTPSEIEQGANQGKVTVEGGGLQRQVEPQDAVQTALQGFEDGLYLVFVDDRQQATLDDLVLLRSDSRVTFVRLVALAGG